MKKFRYRIPEGHSRERIEIIIEARTAAQALSILYRFLRNIHPDLTEEEFKEIQ